MLSVPEKAAAVVSRPNLKKIHKIKNDADNNISNNLNLQVALLDS